MSESSSNAGHGTTLDYRSPGIRPGPITAAKVGGALGVAGTFIGFAIFMAGCAGFEAAFAMSLIPLVLGVVGLLLTFVNGLFEEMGLDDPQVVACYAINIAVIAGAMLEFAIWRGWPVFFR